MIALWLAAALAVEPSEAWTTPWGPDWELSPGAAPGDDPLSWVLVDDADRADAVSVSEEGAVLFAPPEDGTPWRWESVAHLDGLPDAVALDALNADLWHAAGYRGQGVRIAVFDLQFSGAEADPAILDEVVTADCFAHPSCAVPVETVRPDFGFETGVHGFACAEIVRDVAPEAELFLVRVNSLTAFRNAARWAVREQIDLISMSMSFFNGSFYDGYGPFTAVVDELAAGGVLLVTSSGNYARQHWAGRYEDRDGDGFADLAGDNALHIEVNGGGNRLVYVNWNEHGRCGTSDLDVLVFDEAGFIVGRGEDAQDAAADGCSPVERVSFAADESGTYTLRVVGRRVVEGVQLDVMAQSGQLVEAQPGSSIVDPAGHPAAFVVGAVRAAGYLDAGVEGFSSQGPMRGGLRKPDVVGPNGLSVVAYGPNGFFGTSASTPAVTGALALAMSREPELSPFEAADRLRAWAFGTGTQGWDPALGHGKVRLPDPGPADGPVGCGRGLLLAAPWFLVLPARRRRSAQAQG